MSKNNRHNVVDFIKNITEINQKYQKTTNIDELTEDLFTLAEKYHSFIGAGNYLLNLGEEYISNGDIQQVLPS